MLSALRRNSRPDPWVLLLVALQAAYFFAAVRAVSPQFLYADNIYYEMPAWNLARGRGFTISRTDWEDPYLTKAFTVRHPEAAIEDVPAVVFPPGYGFLLAGIYAVVGSRSHVAAVMVNGLLMAVILAGLLALARRSLIRPDQRAIFLVLCSVFPFWAFWAARMMSDTLHTALLTTGIALWVRGEASWRRSLSVGLLTGLATLTRPYTLALPVAFGIFWAVKRRGARALMDAAAVTFISALMMGVWVARNQYYFGEPLVVSLTKGQGLWQATHYEADIGLFGNFDFRENARALGATGIVDPYRYEDNRKLFQLGMEKIRKDPVAFATRTMGIIPRLWIPTGSQFGSTTKGLLILWFGLLFLALLYALASAVRSGDPVLEAAVVIVLYYTVVFLFPGHVESRFVVPARGFSFLLIAAAWPAIRGRLLSRW